MSLPEDTGDRGKERERGARPKVRQSRSEERRDGGRRKPGRGKKKSHPSQDLRPLSDGFEYGDLLSGDLLSGEGAALSQTASSRPPLVPDPGTSRTLRQKIQDAVGQCFPIKTHSLSPAPAPSRRKIHLSELMLDRCPFPAGSDLAQKWYLIKQHTAPLECANTPVLECVSAPLECVSAPLECVSAPLECVGAPVECVSAPVLECVSAPLEDEEDRLRERRRISIEQGVEPPPNAQIHTFEVTAQINPLYKLGPKLAHGMNELAGDERATLHQLLLQTCLDTLDEVAASAPVSASAVPDVEICTAAPSVIRSESPKTQDYQHRVHTQIDYIHCLVPDLLEITNLSCYWGVMDRYEAETLLEGKPEGTFLLRDSAQEDYLFSVSFRRYGRSLHARIEQWNHNFSFDVHDPSVFHAPTVTGLLEHYKDPNSCMFFEPLLSNPIHRTQPFSLQRICRAVISSRSSYDGIGTLPLPAALKEHLKEYHYKQRVRIRRLDTWWE